MSEAPSDHVHSGDAEHVHPHPAPTPDTPPRPILENLSVISVYTFDASKGETGTISYDLLEPARTRIVITAKDDPDQLYRVLFWGWQEAGRQVVEWDGTDQSGYPLDRMACAVGTKAIGKSVHLPGTRVIKPLTTEQLIHGLQGPPDHRRCDPGKCKPMDVRFVGISEKSDAGASVNKELSPGAVLSGVVTIEAEVAKDARGYGDKTGYGVRWMIDQQLVAAEYYEKESNGKFVYALDTTAFRDGEHVLRVSCCDHYDHIGVIGSKVAFHNGGGE
ncbi:MAG: hypothetical protein JSU70_08200 [Phycisphaerales bacterium]|nr:MAG: hypothetical protein JSU70_08200 [Phycisphaerales bacterium]